MNRGRARSSTRIDAAARPLGRTVVALVVVAAVVASSVAGVRAVPAADGLPAPTPAPAPGGPVRAPHIAPELADVPVTGAAYEQARARVDQTEQSLTANRGLLERTTGEIASLTTQRTRLEHRISTDTAIHRDAERQIVTLRLQLRHLALQAYVGAGDASDAAALTLDTETYLRGRVATSLRRSATTTSNRRYVHETAVAAAAARRLRSNRAALLRTVAALARDRDVVTRTRDAIRQGEVDLVRNVQALADARATATVDGTDLPLVALDAYVHAEHIATLMTPGCHLQWSLLAGIGKVESGQGTYGGAALRQDGTLTKPITGIPLDGTQGTEEIRTPGGDPMRAEGPMQFLPSTWAHVAVDGDDDGELDIQNLYDAAATAGAYLCRNGVDLATPQGLRASILTYNFSGEYVDHVTAEMQRYAEALPTLPGT